MRPDEDLTLDPFAGGVTAGVGTAPTPTPSSSRFTPGSIVAGRYRLVALLGKGGMGEVYRAEDLTLDQPVALKFLPEGVAAGDTRLAQFHNELRIARQVSHKNVCRLYDLGDADGRRFLTMEYIDGEDLSSSLRRFGRMPPDKAVQIARQLCAGVAAAHERGVLHRDLKPANVMLDGNGDVRITDFGIATLGVGAGDLAGTPQYMAPELLAGKPASAKSDIYALGLILFEIFTGKRVYDAKTIGELKALHDTQTVTTPSAIVRDLDPVIERVILRCLEKDPERRPSSALTVAAALPGGDPLAAALAAGETPSPDMLVAAAETDAMPVGRAAALLGSFIVMLLLSAVLMTRGSLLAINGLPLPPDVLADRALQAVRSLGYEPQLADRATGLVRAGDYIQWARTNGLVNWWASLKGPALMFWLRTSPREFVPVEIAGRVGTIDPPMNISGMHQVFVDPTGKLVEFHTVPPQVESIATPADPPAWKTAFDLAGFNIDQFSSVPSEWTPRDFADTRAAWEGPWPADPGRRIRIEAAAFRGRVVSFQIVWPWTRPLRMTVVPQTATQKFGRALSVGVWFSMLLGALIIARFNVRTRRADSRGATRLAIVLLVALFASIVLIEEHSTTPGVEINQIMGALYLALGQAGIIWLLYLAIEPYARRFWPDSLLGWTRLLSGHIRDPRVGRELLIGVVLGTALLLDSQLQLLPLAIGTRLSGLPFGGTTIAIMGTPLLLSRWLYWFYVAVGNAMMVTMILVVFRLILRRVWLSLAAGVVLATAAINGGAALSGTWIDTAWIAVLAITISLTIYKFGLLPLATAAFVSNMADGVPTTFNMSAWWASPGLLTLGLLIGLACFAFYAARAGQPLFGRVLED